MTTEINLYDHSPDTLSDPEASPFRETLNRWHDQQAELDAASAQGADAPAAEDASPPDASDGTDGPLDELLRDRAALLARIDAGVELAAVARVMLVTTLVCGVVLGACMGMVRGGVQIVFAGLKFPLVMLVTTAACAPWLTALKKGLGHRASLVRDVALVLSSLALAMIVAASMAPLLLWAVFQQINYHVLILLIVGICGIGGVVGCGFFVKGVRRHIGRHSALICGAFTVVFAVVAMQASWVMRPYVVRPQTEDVPLFRPVEGSFFDAVGTSTRSAVGDYDRPAAPRPEASRRGRTRGGRR